MKSKLNFRPGLAPVLLAVLAAAWPVHAQTTVSSTWLGGSANWSDPTQWSPSAYSPDNGNGGNNFDVTINSGTATLTGPVTLHNLTLSDGVIAGSFDLSLTGDFNWSGGTLANGLTTIAAGQTLTQSNATDSTYLSNGATLTNAGTANISGTLYSGLSSLDTAPDTLINTGTLNLAGTGYIEAGTAVFNLQNSGTINLADNAEISVNVTNTGLIQKNSGFDTTYLNAIIDNTGGTITAQTGTLILQGYGSLISGNYSAAAGAELDLGDANFTLGNATFSGPGTVQFEDATVTGAGTLSGTVGWVGDYNYLSNGATLTNAGTSNISGKLFSGSGDTATDTLINTGTLNLAGTGYIEAGTAVFNLQNSGTINLADNAQIYANVTNTGLIQKNSGFDTTYLNAIIDNTGGTITAQTGTLILQGYGSLISGNYSAAAGAELDLGDAIFTLGNATFSGPGTVQFEDATVTGAGTLSGTVGWVGDYNYLSNGATLTNAGTSNISGKLFSGSGDTATDTLINTGTLNLAGTGYIEAGTAVFNLQNSGTINLADNAQIYANVTNTGLIQKNSGFDTTYLNAIIDNTGGTITAQTGTLILQGYGSLISGNYSAAAGAELDLGDAIFTLGNAIFSGPGTVQFEDATVTGSGTLSGTVGWVGDYNYLSNGSTLTNAGTLNLSGSLYSSYYSGDTAPDTLINTGTLNLSGSGYIAADYAALNLQNSGTINLADNAQIYANVTNTGLIQKNSGSGTTYLGNLVTNSATGTIKVQSGTIECGSGYGLANAGTLSGLGTFSGTVTNLSGGHIAPGGDTPGTLTFADVLILNDGSVLDLQLGTVSDFIDVTGGLVGNASAGGITIDILAGNGFKAGTYDFLQGGTVYTLDAADFNVGSAPAGYSYEVDFDGSMLSLVVTPVPEPATWAILTGLASLGWVIARRRRTIVAPQA